jgi:electron transfer flavoprotein beta subunit
VRPAWQTLAAEASCVAAPPSHRTPPPPLSQNTTTPITTHSTTNQLGVDLANVKMSMNPFCEIAVEEALRLKEQGHATEVVAVAVGAPAAQETLRTALAMGADRAVLVQAGTGNSSPQPLGVARLLAALAKREGPGVGMVLLGKQSVDSDANQTGQMLAALLRWPQATFASKVEVVEAAAAEAAAAKEGGRGGGGGGGGAAAGRRARVTREVDGGLETLEVGLPAVVTADLRLNTPRYATLPNIMRAKKKPLEVVSAESLLLSGAGGGGSAAEGAASSWAPQLDVLSVEEPAKRKAGVMVASVEELVDKLHREAKVI